MPDYSLSDLCFVLGTAIGNWETMHTGPKCMSVYSLFK